MRKSELERYVEREGDFVKKRKMVMDEGRNLLRDLNRMPTESIEKEKAKRQILAQIQTSLTNVLVDVEDEQMVKEMMALKGASRLAELQQIVQRHIVKELEQVIQREKTENIEIGQ